MPGTPGQIRTADLLIRSQRVDVKQKLLNDLCLFAVRTLVKFLHTATDLKLMPGVVALKKLFFDETEGKVCYQYDGHSSQEESMDYLKFIAESLPIFPTKDKS